MDPQGAVLMPFKDENESPELEGMPAVGTFCWDELLTSDPAAAAKFYAGVYGFTVDEREMGPMGTYRVLKRGERMTGGIMKQPMPNVPPHWSAHVAVADIEAATKRVETLKGKVIVPPMEVPGMGRFAVFSDRAGATLQIFQGK
jgi:predicted enzyme related to lactoylglutathione lyase